MTDHLTTTLTEFDKKFPGLATVHHAEGEIRTIYGVPAEHLVKAFITSRYADLEKKIEGLKTSDAVTDDPERTYERNNALDDVLNIIRDNH